MFKRAERRQSKLRMAICGPSGSGKTYSALLIAKGLGSKIAVLDTERGSASLYSHLLEYDVAELVPPFSPKRYQEVIKAAERGGYEVLIIDSLSHAWAGEGGILEMHEKTVAAQRTTNTYTAWREVTPHHNALVDSLLTSPLHVICTLRTKTAYDIVDKDGKKRPVKIGLAPVQRDGLEYEFTLTLDLSIDSHMATAAKDRTGLFDGRHWVPSEDTGMELASWLGTAIKPTEKPAEDSLPQAEVKDSITPDLVPNGISKGQWDTVKTKAKSLGIHPKALWEGAMSRFGVQKPSDLTVEQLEMMSLDLDGLTEAGQ